MRIVPPAAIGLFLTVMISCGDTDPVAPFRDHPLDQHNPNGGGNPFDLRSSTEAQGIRLLWNPIDQQDLAGYRLYRRGGEGGEFRLARQTELATWLDGAVRPGATYEYKLGSVSDAAEESDWANTAPLIAHSLPSFTIAGGEAYAASRLVHLDLLAADADSIWVWNGEPADSESAGRLWLKADSAATWSGWQLPPGAGQKTVRASLRYRSGVEMGVSDAIEPLPARNLGFSIGTASIADPDTVSVNDVVLHILAESATEMLIGDSPDFAGAEWVPYAPTMSWDLGIILRTRAREETGAANREADYRLYCKVRNDFEMESIELSDEVAIDIASRLRIVDDDQDGFTVGRWVDLRLWSENADHMLLSNDSDFAGAQWIPYRSEVNDWELSQGPGTKTVHCRFRNESGAESRTIAASIAPLPFAPVVVVAGGQPFTATRRVQLALGDPAAVAMKISNRSDLADAGWEACETIVQWDLLAGGGEKTVYVRFLNDFGDSSAVVGDGIDPLPFAPVITIAGGEPFTAGRSVELTLADPAALLMKISGSPDLAGADWEQYMASRQWELSGGEGTKTVYVRYRNDFGDSSSVASDEIDPLPFSPFLTISDDEPFTASRLVELTLADPAAVQMKISNGPDRSESVWEAFSPLRQWELADGPGTKTVHVKYRNDFGDSSVTAIDQIEPLPFDPSCEIDGGAQYTATRAVQLALGDPAAVKMKISNTANLAGALWEPLAASRGWSLAPGGGTKTVYVRYLNAFGDSSAIVSDEIDPLPFDPIVAIAGDEPYTVSRQVQLTLGDQAAVQMKVSNLPDLSGAIWEALTDTKLWELSQGAGVKAVYVRYLNEFGDSSLVVSDDINPLPFAPGISIAGDQPFTATRAVALALGDPAALRMKVSNSPDLSDAIWESLAPAKQWQLSAGGGLKTVYARYMNDFGDSSAVVSDDINPLPFDPRIAIAADQPYTRLRAVELALADQAAVQMKLSDLPDLAGAIWEPFSPAVAWQLPSGGGTKTVYVRYRNDFGEASAVVSDDINPFPFSPAISIAGDAPFTARRAVELALADPAAVQMKVSNAPDLAGAAWETVAESKAWSLTAGGGAKTVYARYLNDFGDSSIVTSDDIVPLPFDPRLAINDDAPFTASQSVQLALADPAAVQMMISRLPDLSDASWEPYAETRAWQLGPGEGAKAVYARYRNDFDELSQVLSDDITLDQTGPNILGMSGTPVDGTEDVPLWAQLSWTPASDDLSGIAGYRVLMDRQYPPMTQVYAGTEATCTVSRLLYLTSYYWRVVAVDGAGNESIGESRELITTDTIIEDIFIEAGSFLMGSPTSEPGRIINEYRHEVTLTRDLTVSLYEVTEAQWAALMGGDAPDPRLPQGNVSWDGAVAFCNALSEVEGLTPAYEIHGPNGDVTWLQDADGWRLPTEAEWEYLCRAGSATAFANGPITDTFCGEDPSLDAIGWYCFNAPEGREEYGLKVPNAWGLYDMHGNLWEWCWDGYRLDYEALPDTDPMQAAAPGANRVIRGGSWSNLARYCRSACRFNTQPLHASDLYSFRPVRTGH